MFRQTATLHLYTVCSIAHTCPTSVQRPIYRCCALQRPSLLAISCQLILTCVSSQSHSSRFAKRAVSWKPGHTTTGARGKPPFLLHAKCANYLRVAAEGKGHSFLIGSQSYFLHLLIVQTRVLARVVVMVVGDLGLSQIDQTLRWFGCSANEAPATIWEGLRDRTAEAHVVRPP